MTVSPAEKAPSRALVVAVPEVADTGVPPTSQAKDRVVVSPSRSEPEPEQLSVLSRVAPELGVTTAVAEGSRLLVVSEAVPVSEPPSVSEAVAVQVTSSRDATAVSDRSTVLTVDRVLPLLSVHT